MATTQYSALRYPTSTDVPNGPQQIQNLATDVDQKVMIQVANSTARTGLTSAQRYDGMHVYEISTKRKYRWDGTAGAWVYAGGAPPPITALTVAAGWAAATGFAPGVYKDSQGLVHVTGGVTNNVTYTPGGGAPVTLPVGFRPAVDTAVNVLVNASTTVVLGGVYASDGTLRLNVGGSITAGSVHTFNGIYFHPGFTGGALA